ncbi:MAG: hypothetical protein E7036_00475 [Opitutales bacterium]|nr:hypothetical protein [Opitutales bacterium]MBP3357293.1 hypothetical protein [Opitutales bacterium]MBQ2722112.1 hypothetical protein [Opitutales bacterium]
MKKYSKKQKILLMSISLVIAICAYFTAYSAFTADMTDWQKKQKIDFQANTGATKFKARIDSLSIAGLAFCVSAITIIAIKKITEKK